METSNMGILNSTFLEDVSFKFIKILIFSSIQYLKKINWYIRNKKLSIQLRKTDVSQILQKINRKKERKWK